MLSDDTIDHFRFEGARLLLSPLRASRVSDSPEKRDTALEPSLRALWLAGERGGRTLYEVAAEVRLIADALEPGAGSDAVVPADLRELVTGWAAERPETLLRAIASHVESWKAGFVAKLSQATPTSQELARRFPQLNEFLLNYYGQDGMATEGDMTEEDGLQLFIQHCHPICLWRLPPITAECTEALAVFHEMESLRQFFEKQQGMGSGTLAWSDWLLLIVETFTVHMREQHPSHWISG
ncbi:hypothetical protein [Streptomyces sp. V4I2]|uniref:hypothetical protein n=1 Tax=Streptomyces sp. V4I2 TaxID=3042280 RepID=UPI0027820D75|nr:hypothetical protein [Streptomyces sp. V4I2]MDQ1049013.1 hypothetical protein [Streptomyces sp. V4I2]